MKKGKTAAARQLSVLLFLSLAVDIAVRPFTAGSRPSAQILIPAAAIDTALAVLVCIPLVRTVNSGDFAVMKSGANAASRVFLVLAAALFTCAASAAYLRTWEFIRYVSDEPMPQIVMIVVPALCIFYALRCGKEGLMRTFQVVNAVFLCSFALLLISNVQSMQFSHLQLEAFDPKKIFEVSGRSFTLMPELLLFCFFAAEKESGTQKSLVKVLILLAVFYMGVTFFTELVIGTKAQTQMQTVHTLSRLGSISVFRRLDTLHSAVWLMAELCKISALCCASADALKSLSGKEHGDAVQAVCVFLLLLTAAGLWVIPPQRLHVFLTIGTGGMMLYAVCWHKIMEAMHDKKNA